MSLDLAPKVKEARGLYVLIPLLVFHLALISLQIQDPSGMLLFRRWVLSIGTPIFYISATTTGGVRYMWSNYLWLHGAREENQALKAKVQQLSMRQDALRQLEQENARLRRLLELNQAFQLNSVGARVVARAPNFLAGTLYLDKGEQDGVRKDAPVLSDLGLVGRITVVSAHYSQVQLLTTPDASVGAMVERTRVPGVVKGNGSSRVELRYVGNTEEVEAGDVVLTSGLDEIYPKGIRIGKVVESRKGKSVFRMIQVAPTADLLRIEEALVLLPDSRATAAHHEFSDSGKESEVAATSVGLSR